jgi:hypothetical protein
MAGVKYPTFANWLQERRKAQPPVVEEAREVLLGGGGVRLLQAVVEDHATGSAGSGAGLCIELPGGGRLIVDSPVQLAMAAELLSLMAQRHRGC